MKNLLTLAVSVKMTEKPSDTLYDGIELIYIENDESEQNFLARLAKTVTGKYCILCNRKFILSDVQSLLNILDKNTSDLVSFTGGAAIKTSIVKNAVKTCKDVFSCEILSILGCKTILKTTYMPLIFQRAEVFFSEQNDAGILVAAEAFSTCKAKLTKEIYSYALTALCHNLVSYYLYAILAVREGSWDKQALIDFDYKLKTEIVLYLALEKNFTAGNLHKLREKEFSISWLKARKIKKLLSVK